VDKIIDNIASDEERIHWFDGVPIGHDAERGHKEWLRVEKLSQEELDHGTKKQPVKSAERAFPSPGDIAGGQDGPAPSQAHDKGYER
jgi:hypothetical protein